MLHNMNGTSANITPCVLALDMLAAREILLSRSVTCSLGANTDGLVLATLENKLYWSLPLMFRVEPIVECCALRCFSRLIFLCLDDQLFVCVSVCRSTKALDNAAARGHLEVVLFLLANRNEGCTERALDWSSRGGCEAIYLNLDRRARIRVSLYSIQLHVLYATVVAGVAVNA